MSVESSRNHHGQGSAAAAIDPATPGSTPDLPGSHGPIYVNGRDIRPILSRIRELVVEQILREREQRELN